MYVSAPVLVCIIIIIITTEPNCALSVTYLTLKGVKQCIVILVVVMVTSSQLQPIPEQRSFLQPF